VVIATQQRRWLAWTATLLAGLALLVADTARVSAELPPVPAPGDAADPMARPAPDEPLRDLAGVLSSAEFRTLRQSIRDLRDDTGVPVYALVLNHIPPAADGPIAPVNADDASRAAPRRASPPRTQPPRFAAATTRAGSTSCCMPPAR